MRPRAGTRRLRRQGPAELLDHLPLINFEQQVGIALAVRKECLRRRGLIAEAVVRPPARCPARSRCRAAARTAPRRLLEAALMDLGLTGRTALVLASTGGLGAAVATRPRPRGRPRRRHRPQPRARPRSSPASLPSAVGVARRPHRTGRRPRRVIEATRAAYGDPDIVVLNGPGPAPGPAAALDPDRRRSRGRGAAAPARRPGPRGAARRCGPRGWGRILAVGSSGVEAPLANLAASNVGRAALAAYLKTLAAEVAADGVTVNMLLPGRIATDRVAASRRGRRRAAGPARRRRTPRLAGRTIPVGRYGEPAEFGAVGAFLCSALASYVTGSLVRCDGGLLAHL